jgi:hypothetical protein
MVASLFAIEYHDRITVSWHRRRGESLSKIGSRNLSHCGKPLTENGNSGDGDTFEDIGARLASLQSGGVLPGNFDSGMMTPWDAIPPS